MSLLRRPFADRDRQLGDRAAAQHLERDRLADAIAEQQIEQLLRRFDGMAVELEQQVADQDAGRRRRARRS